LELLTDDPLSQIALDGGFTDQPHLTRLFRRIVGVTPAAWRRLRRVGPSGRGTPPLGAGEADRRQAEVVELYRASTLR
jgi:AraC-like DNA-binding protein